MSVPFFTLNRQNKEIKSDLLSAIERCLDGGSFILGKSVGALEKHMADFIGVKYAVGLASGTDALHLALLALGIKEGDEVITSPFTFVATAEAISYCGARPVFADIEPNTFNLDVPKIKLSTSTKAILPVHLYGQPANMKEVSDFCRSNNKYLIEDCAQAIGAEFNGKKVGSFGDIGCFSYFPTKNLGCFGDGGIITTNNSELANQVKVLRGHGSSKTYHYDIIGYNSRLDALQAEILLVRFKHLASWDKKRKQNASLYQKDLKGLEEIVLPYVDPKSSHVFNQFTIRAKDRDKLFDHLRRHGIGCMVYYPLCLHLQKAFAYLGYKKGDFPESERAQEEVLSLPIFPELEESEIAEACEAIRKFYKK